MRLYVVIRYVGMILLLISAFMFVSFFISLYHNDDGLLPLLLSALLTFLTGVFPLIFVPVTKHLSSKEGYLVVVIGWIVVCLYSMLPYLLYGGEFTPVNAWFESVSGYTTTGSTILTDIEVVPRGLLFWRSATHWMGGIGVVLFVLVVIPAMGNARITLTKIEMSPLAKTDFRYRSEKMLRIILSVYIGLTVVETVLLMIFGMSAFDAVTHSFATIATGGFSPKNSSIAYYNSVPIDIIVIVFMLLSGIHFGLLYGAFTFKNKSIFKSAVVKYYLLSIIIGIVLVAINIKSTVYQSWGESFRFAAFQVVSLGTTTGFANADSSIWPPFSIMLLLFFTIQCACAGSTSGGMKVDRVVIFFKSIQRQITKIQHPQAVVPVRINRITIDDEIVDSVLLFICVYIGIIFLTGLGLTAMGVNTLEAFSASAATMGNVGPGFEAVGSLGNFANIPTLGKLLLSLNMLLGRLEIYGLLLFFMMKSWK